jgi:hypothetical protein
MRRKYFLKGEQTFDVSDDVIKDIIKDFKDYGLEVDTK